MKFGYPSDKDFREGKKKRNKARLAQKRQTDAELRQRHRILNNDYRHLFQTGQPWGGD